VTATYDSQPENGCGDQAPVPQQDVKVCVVEDRAAFDVEQEHGHQADRGAEEGEHHAAGHASEQFDVMLVGKGTNSNCQLATLESASDVVESAISSSGGFGLPPPERDS
jgi:hypothetical protein